MSSVKRSRAAARWRQTEPAEVLQVSDTKPLALDAFLTHWRDHTRTSHLAEEHLGIPRDEQGNVYAKRNIWNTRFILLPTTVSSGNVLSDIVNTTHFYA